MEEEINLFTAIAEMRNLTQKHEPFSLVWMGYSRSRGNATGKKDIQKCLLRKASTQKQNQYSDSMLNLYNVDTKENRECWQPLIMYFNGKKVTL